VLIRLKGTGDLEILCSGNLTAEVDGTISLTSGKKFTIKSNEEVKIDAPKVVMPNQENT
jgi:hypothetical protein